MLPRVVLKRSWRPLGGALGGPRGSQVGPKSKLEGCFSEVEKALVYNKLFLNAFFVVLGAPWGSKNEHFALEGLQKLTCQEVAF